MTSLAERVKKAFYLQEVKGNNYIRVGKNNDGGYVMVDDLKPTDYVLSMGIANDVSFEQGLQDKVLKIDMYDMSIRHLPGLVTNGSFFKEKIGGDSAHVFNNIPKKSDAILKIDIEGGEWEFFKSLSLNQISKFRQIIVEIHWAIENPYIKVKDMPVDVLEKLNETHQLVVIHPNNYGATVKVGEIDVPQVIELTYLRKNSYDFTPYTGLPESLFMPNDPLNKELKVDFL